METRAPLNDRHSQRRRDAGLLLVSRGIRKDAENGFRYVFPEQRSSVRFWGSLPGFSVADADFAYPQDTVIRAVFFTFPSRYYFSIGHWVVFSLGGWPPLLQTGLHVSGPTLVPSLILCISSTGLSPCFADLSRVIRLYIP